MRAATDPEAPHPLLISGAATSSATDRVWPGSQSADGLDLEVIVPAYNEEFRIGPTLLALAGHLSAMPISGAIRVIDNGSSDRTAEVVDPLSTANVPITVSGCSRRGKGAAVRRGVLTSRARWVGFCDADLATAPTAIDDVVSLLADGWQVVIGSRRHSSSRVTMRQPLVRRFGGTAFRMVSRRYVGDLTDTQCGFKFFEGMAARRLFSTVTLTGFAFDLEVLAKARRMGLSIIELGVEWNDRSGSTFAPLRDSVEVARELWLLHRSMTER
ncbi:glycosyltransferase [Actinoplanes aureus]|uniref:Glycosyltransferase n=1 Tax=Actinoplanes aureus TaxID=2792083 RepID=A0A931CIR8_9ACTN|nr:glycosyltransferase [Actinoplanes aureus]MBG0565675.1 glycosyltransferase [Actinoplanes aureus]